VGRRRPPRLGLGSSRLLLPRVQAFHVWPCTVAPSGAPWWWCGRLGFTPQPALFFQALQAVTVLGVVPLPPAIPLKSAQTSRSIRHESIFSIFIWHSVHPRSIL